jgi:nucleoside-diphosphate-sugar epimerase
MPKIRPSAAPAPSGAPRRTVLLTGASGVVGHALLPRLLDGGADVVCLVHRTPVAVPGVTCVTGDVRQEQFGLAPAAYAELAGRVDAVVHCAAVTDFNRDDGSLENTNVTGTAHVVAFTEQADATLYHVSTAFVHTRAQGERGRTAVGYATSKRTAEDVVRASRGRHVVVRPSIVIGDSATGDVAAFQGLHGVAGAILSGAVPLIPFDAAWPVDFLPSDVVADAIATLVETGVDEGEFWLTAGERALRLDEAVRLCLEVGAEHGVVVDPPRFVPPEMYDRLIGPVFLDALPRRVQRTVTRLLEFFATYLSSDSAMPSDLPALAAAGAAPLPDQATSLQVSLRHYVRVMSERTLAAA